MAEKIMNSQEFNQILENTQNKIIDIDNNIDNIKNDIITNLNIVQSEYEYMSYLFSNMTENTFITDYKNNILDIINSRSDINIELKQEVINTINALNTSMVFSKSVSQYLQVLCNEDVTSGVFEKYGKTVHPKTTRKINLFNLNTNKGTLFRTDVTARLISKGSVTDCTDILKSDLVSDKKVFFKEMDSDIFQLEVLVNTENLLGGTKCSMIEIDPLIPGGFDITSIDIYSVSNQNISSLVKQINNITNASQSRIIISNDDFIQFSKIVFNIKANYSVNRNDIKIYPFGMKHIYFYDAAFDSNSYIVTKINTEDPIYTINDNIILKTINNISHTTISEMGIELYGDYIDGEYSTVFYPSSSNMINEIIKILKTVYIKIPLFDAVISAQLDITTKN